VKKIITGAKNRNEIFKQQQLTIGVDLGDRISHYCILDETGNVILEQSVPTTPKGIQQDLAQSNGAGDRDTFALGKPAVDAVGP
jgi:predicted NBD/HSP70 family sugar kinase